MNDDHDQPASPESDARVFRQAMFLRRCFLILAVPLLLFLTIFSLHQWQRLWQMLLP